MGLPQPLVDALRDVEQAEKFNPAEAFRKGTEESIRKMLGEFRRLLGDLEKGVEEVKGSARDFLQETEREISCGRVPQDLDVAVDWLSSQEEDRRKQLPALLELVQKLQADTFSSRMAAADKARLLSACDRFITASRVIPQTLRDLRWSLMALRAEGEDPGDAPVFDNPQDLLDYLKTPSK
ncbi:MAG TPA: hypothetical protein VF173_22825 [Thermoanaerobaculia bacterium]|nr:hypothetical protein [Thermoanaerobaculia bacterium]